MVTFSRPLNPPCSTSTPTCVQAGIRSKVVPEGGRNTWMGVVVITKTGGPRHLLNFTFSFIFLSLCFEILKLRKCVEVWKQTVVHLWRDCLFLFSPLLLARLVWLPRIGLFLPSNAYFWVMQIFCRFSPTLAQCVKPLCKPRDCMGCVIWG